MPDFLINFKNLTYNNIFYVNINTGSDTNDGSELFPFATIQHAIDSASNGDCIVIKEGIYQGAVDNYGLLHISKCLDFIGIGKPVIKGNEYNTVQIFGDNLNVNFYRIEIESFGDIITGSDDSYAALMYVNGNNNNINFYNCILRPRGKIFISNAFHNYNTININNSVLDYSGHNFGSEIFRNYESTMCSLHSYNCIEIGSYTTRNLYSSNTLYFYYGINTGAKTFTSYQTEVLTYSNAAVDSNYNIINPSDVWKNNGDGTNPDGTQAHIGVYGGPYAWGEWVRYHLFKDNGNILTYNILTNQWEVVGIAGDETQYTYENYGITNLQEIPTTKLKELSSTAEISLWIKNQNYESCNLNITGVVNDFYKLNSSQPRLLYWISRTNEQKNIKMDFVPKGQLILPTGDINLKDIKKINKIQIKAKNINGNLKFILSKDGGQTWYTHNPGSFTENLVPVMTSNTTPEGVAFSNTSYSTDYAAWKAFDNNPNTVWQQKEGNYPLPYQLGYEFSMPQIVNRYTIAADLNYPDKTPSAWTFEAWDGTNWIVLDERNNELNWQENKKREYTFANGNAYNKYRINITANSGNTTGYTSISEMEFKAYIIEPNKWNQITTNLFDISTNGMSLLTINSITDWSFIDTDTLRIGYYLEKNSINDVVEVDQLDLNVSLLGYWENGEHMKNYNYEYLNNIQMKVSLLSDGTYKINY